MMNHHYPSHEEYLFAVAREIAKEYRYIADQGYLLQIDAPDLAMERASFFQDLSLRKFQERVVQHIEAINVAIEGIPRDRVRLHSCWGNRDGPHTEDVALEHVLPHLLEARVGAICLPFANPRHSHEVEALGSGAIPGDPGRGRGGHRIDQQLRRTPGGGEAADPRGGTGTRGPRAPHRRGGLRLRDLRGRQLRGRGCGLGKARDPRGGGRSSPPPISGSRPAAACPCGSGGTRNGLPRIRVEISSRNGSGRNRMAAGRERIPRAARVRPDVRPPCRRERIGARGGTSVKHASWLTQ